MIFIPVGLRRCSSFFMVTDVYFGNNYRLSIVPGPALVTFHPVPDGVLGEFPLKQFSNLCLP